MYPVCLNIVDKLCIVIGGGSVAERKVRGLLAAGGMVRLISPEVTDTLAGLAAEGSILWRCKEYENSDLEGGFLVFAATDNRDVQAAVCHDAQRTGMLVNVADAPESCSFQVPATVHRGDLTLSVGTGGKSPAVAAMIRHRLEQEFGREYAVLIDLIAMIRTQVLADDSSLRDRKILFQKLLHDDIVLWIRNGQWDALQEHLQHVLGSEVTLDFSRLKQDTA